MEATGEKKCNEWLARVTKREGRKILKIEHLIQKS